MADVIPIRLTEIGEGVTLGTGKVLDATPRDLRELVVVGLTADGEVYVAGTDGAAKAVWLLEKGKAHVLNAPSPFSVF